MLIDYELLLLFLMSNALNFGESQWIHNHDTFYVFSEIIWTSYVIYIIIYGSTIFFK